ncbi:hypothetical protein BDB01DRAFT_795326 [Pilobolus umbonatus]|nr:hypothetical protein BDB01DRAFT_795326 [Pilobolus umbonatus]
MPLFNHLATKVKLKLTNTVNNMISTNNDDSDLDSEEEYSSQENRFGSFAPIRQEAAVKYFIDGQNYCWAVAEAIESATECIFIEDWWLSPELYLKRPASKYPQYRIDNLLKRKAEEGVMIYVVVYKEIDLALTLDSWHTKSTLQELHKNIIVQRHPDHAVGGTFFWSHHEKFVIVDNRIAFLGGLDLCYGRWDTPAHRLIDFTYKNTSLEIFPGQDYSNARLRDFEQVKEWDMRLIDKSNIPRMPWHDISLCMLGLPVLDVSRHFCDRWNFIKNSKSMDKTYAPFLKPPVGGYSNYQNFKISIDDRLLSSYHFHSRVSGVHGSCRTQVLRSSAEWSTGTPLEKSIQTAYIDTITQAKYYIYIENQFFITSTTDDSNYILQNQIGRAIVNRIVRAHQEQAKFKVFVLMPLMPAFPAELSTKEAGTAKLVMYYQYISICSGEHSIINQLRERGINPDEYIRFYSLRTYDRLNQPMVEELMAREAGFTPQTMNDQHSRKKNVANLPPAGFVLPGQVDRFSERKCDSDDPEKIKEFEKQQVDEYVTEELYIHAKLLIADDRIVIMGSANLNDRSQCGDRDSEIALIIEDTDMLPSKMDNQSYQAGRFAATLRRQLWKEHLGLLPEADVDNLTADMLPLPIAQCDNTQTKEDFWVMDPLDEDTLNRWNYTANTNTKAFREVFHCVPDDTITNWAAYSEFYPNLKLISLGHVYDPYMPLEEVRKHLNMVKGHLVEFPMSFLCNEDLAGEAVPIVNAALQELYT